MIAIVASKEVWKATDTYSDYLCNIFLKMTRGNNFFMSERFVEG